MIGNESTPLVSVIINCYNGDKYLREAIDSVFAQTYTNWEIIFWDNCSTDDSAEIAKSYDERLKYYFAHSNTRLGDARNHAIEKATGEFIAFIDVDDIWLHEKLEIQINAIKQNPEYILCYTGVLEFFNSKIPDREYLPNYESGHIINNLLLNFNIHIVSALISKKKLDQIGMRFDSNLYASEEYCLFMNLSLNNPICVINKPLVKYRITSSSLTYKMLDRLGYERRYSLDKLKKLQNFNKYVNLKFYNKAYAQSYYYDAKYYVSKRERLMAMKNMLKTKFIDLRYVGLFLILILPLNIWENFHIMYKKRL